MRRKATFRSNRGKAPMQQFASVQASESAAVYMPLHGFTAVDLGYQRGDAVSNIVNKFDEPANTGIFLNLFDQIWNDSEKLEDVTTRLCVLNFARQQARALSYQGVSRLECAARAALRRCAAVRPYPCASWGDAQSRFARSASTALSTLPDELRGRTSSTSMTRGCL